MYIYICYLYTDIGEEILLFVVFPVKIKEQECVLKALLFILD